MQNLTAPLLYHARLRPDAEALVCADLRLTWAGLADRVLRLAGGLREVGVGPDTIVALMMKNSAAFVELLYAISHLGAVALPLNFRLSTQELDYIAGHAGVSLLLADDDFAATVQGLTLPVTILDADARADIAGLLGGACIKQSSPRSGGDLMRLMYTSGTTDRPKGVMHSYDNFRAKNLDMVRALQLTAADRLAVVGPLYHVGAADLPGLAVHEMGGALVILRDFDARAVAEMIAAERITGIWLAPVMTSAILALDLDSLPDMSSLRWCIGGGDRTPEGRIREFGRYFPNACYLDAYGMTETVSGDTLMEPGMEIAKIGSVGRPVALVELEVRDEHGASLPNGAEGEICMRGTKVSQGYWKDPSRTADAHHPDGFMRSGDMGYMDEDGFLFLTDRQKDMIISGGENVASSEVERVIHLLPQVLEVAVVARPDPKWGEVPVAVVVLRPGASLGFEALVSHCRAHLAGFKCPKALRLVDRLPRNPSGKVLKRVLRDQLPPPPPEETARS